MTVETLGPTRTVLTRLGELADPLRLRVLMLLEREELTVGEVARVVQVPQSTASRHLKVLAEGGWLAKRSARTATLYRLTVDDLSPADRSLWTVVREQAAGLPESEDDRERLAGVLAERAEDSVAFFGRVAGAWDSYRTELFGDRFAFQSLMGLLPADWVVADLGCGTGNVSELLAGWVSRVIAVDRSEPMLDAARQRVAGFIGGANGEAAGTVEFVLGPLEELPLAAGSVDAAVCSLVLHHAPDPVAVLASARWALRADRGGGVLLVVDMVEHGRAEFRHQMGHKHLGFSAERVEAMFGEAGFSGVRVRRLPAAARATGPGLFAAVGRVRE